MSEIKINYNELEVASKVLAKLRQESPLRLKSTIDMVCQSKGFMGEELNKFYETLVSVEDRIIEIVNKTIELLEKVGMEFKYTEKELSDSLYQVLFIEPNAGVPKIEEPKIELPRSSRP